MWSPHEDLSESSIRVTDPMLQESIAASESEAGMANDDYTADLSESENKEVNA